MAKDVTTGIVLTAEGEKEFTRGVDNSSEALKGFEAAGNNAKTSIDRLDSAMDDMAKDARENSKTVEDNMEAAANNAAAAFLNAVAFIGEVNAAIIAGVNEVAEKGDAIAKGAQQMGLTAEAYQEWSFILERSGSSITKAKNAIETLTKASRNASDKQVKAFEQLGLSMKQVAAMSPEEIFSAVISGLQGIDDAGERSQIANTLLGASYKNLGTLLTTTAEETDELRQKAYDLGQVMSNDSVKAAADYEDSIDDFNAAIDGIKTNLLQGLMPTLTTARNGLTDFLQNDINWDDINAKLSRFYDTLLSGAGWLLDHSGEIAAGVETIGGAWLAWKGTEVVMQAVNGLKDMYGWLEAVGSLIGVGGLTAAGGIGLTALGAYEVANRWNDLKTIGTIGDGHELAEYADNVAYLEQKLQEAQAAFDNLALSGGDLTMAQDEIDLIRAAIINATAEYEAMQAAKEAADAAGPDPAEQAEQAAANAKAASGAAQELSEAGETIQQESEKQLQAFSERTGEITSTFVEGTDEMSQAAVEGIQKTQDAMETNMAILNANAEIWGDDMMRSMANGILGGANNYVVAAVETVAKAIEERLGFSEPDKGPLSRFHEFAPDMMALFAQGIREGQGLLDAAIGDVFDLGPLIAAQNGGGQNFNYGGVNVTIYGAEGQSADELYEVFSYRLQHDVADREAVFSS